ncbi:hypothetical protein T459_30943 [Capsicum annuum]|uniref:H(+)-exporting diphosphatase n=1 Tax=Capsicum annuum TaxID=4072 RepID=A0A2G2Y9U6_CAPAN|nr:hypothetical protein T459_30943 [Capsicum annuum]
MLIFLFSAWACSAVGQNAQEIVNEVTRQFIERPGIMWQDYKEKSNYGRCVSIIVSTSLGDDYAWSPSYHIPTIDGDW